MYLEQNDTYDGAIGLVVNNEATIGFKPNDFFIPRKYVDYLTVIESSHYVSSQMIEKKLKNDDPFSIFSLLLPSYEFAGLLITGIILNFSLLSIFSRLYRKLKHSKLSQIQRMLSFCFMIFVWLLTQLLSTNMNTINIIVDIEDILYSKDKM